MNARILKDDIVSSRLPKYFDVYMKEFRNVLEQREEILRAFIAKYGCGPEEIEQVEVHEGLTITWFLRKKG